ncbi:MAG TPA: response regulator [Steroidobacteraceae bacterium]|nr:response regulator [Steroidobacteraceae bacterium]
MAASLAGGGGRRLPDGPREGRGGQRPVSILLVDDQPARLLTYETVLRDLGHNLVLAQSGAEALGWLMREEFALLLLDVSMPQMDGFETARLIHEHPRFEKTPIIFVTGVHVTELDHLKGYEAGAVDYVSIPVVPEILRSKVGVLVELYCKRRELRELNASLAEANARLAEANLTLQAEKTRELERLNATLQQANADLERANANLQREVAERARAERALKDADRRKDEFLATLAHELRNPLAPITNALQIVRLRPGEAQLNWAQEVIQRQVHYLTRLVDDLLDVSRITRGKITLARETLEVSTLIERAVETVAPLLQERQHRLHLAPPAETLSVSGDPVRLVQAIGNVLGNAAKYTPTGGHIRVTASRSAADAEIRITDDGVGISAERLPTIFELFTQGDRDAANAHGLGIGLALVRRLLDMHGGSIAAHSAGLGHGSEFVLRLPLTLQPVRTAEAGTVDPLPGRGATRRRVLIADDNADTLETLGTMLELNGHQVFRATNGELALEAAARHQPDIALLDVGMPRLDGYEVARRIRAQDWGRDTVLVAVTGWGQDADRRRSREAGFDLHLVKPLDAGALDRLLSEPPQRQAYLAGSAT